MYEEGGVIRGGLQDKEKEEGEKEAAIPRRSVTKISIGGGIMAEEDEGRREKMEDLETDLPLPPPTPPPPQQQQKQQQQNQPSYEKKRGESREMRQPEAKRERTEKKNNKEEEEEEERRRRKEQEIQKQQQQQQHHPRLHPSERLIGGGDVR